MEWNSPPQLFSTLDPECFKFRHPINPRCFVHTQYRVEGRGVPCQCGRTSPLFKLERNGTRRLRSLHSLPST